MIDADILETRRTAPNNRTDTAIIKSNDAAAHGWAKQNNIKNRSQQKANQPTSTHYLPYHSSHPIQRPYPSTSINIHLNY
jgi:hypothetical protein